MPGMLVSRAMLERHLDTIGRRHRFVTLDELGRAIENGDFRGRPMAAITFDDGYRDVYENAFPLLVRKGIPAAVFVVSDLVGTHHLQVHDRLYLLLCKALARSSALAARLGQRAALAAVPRPSRERICRTASDAALLTVTLLPILRQSHVQQLMEDLEAEFGLGRPHDSDSLLPMTWSMLKEMLAKGMTIGSHSCSHARLANERADVLARETAESRARLERQLGVPVTHFAYPNGSFNPAAVDAVAESGYRFGYTACAHRDARHPFLTIPRVLLSERSSVDIAGEFEPAILNCQARGLLTGQRTCRRRNHA
jgi:peptidoglycan/xylan/chitin deacetylase (PgdA/CDA1 family)